MLIGDTSSPPVNEKNMKYTCPQCGTVYDLTAEHYNRKLECQCGAKFEISPPDEAAAVQKPHADIGLTAAHVVAGLVLLIGSVIFVFAGLNYLNFQKIPDLLISMAGLFLFLVGCIISVLTTIADKLHKIEWYISKFYKSK